MATTTDTAEIIAQIHRLERDQFDALIEGDAARLGTLLAEERSYIHTNGKRESRQQLMAALATGRRRYRQIEIESLDVSLAGEKVCIVVGRALLEMEANHGALLFPIAYTALHVRAADGWRLRAWHATRCAPE